MTRYRVAGCTVAAVAALLAPAVAHADPPPPEVGSPCPAEQVDAMTLLPDEQTYVRCQEQFGWASSWVPVQTPFDPNDTWLSYGPAITLHGQGMRNPNLSSGQWTATPLDPETVCRATQTTVVEAGVLAEPVVSEGEPGESLSVQMLPRLFYAELAGDCLWVKD
ncbi:MAG: hypothetical protein KDB56_12035 [Mycobacterium sp.]|nr:hypothetical protein [Mycobacterium sp.]